MEWSEEVNNALGAENVRLLIKEVQDGKIKKEQVKQITLQMHAKANGVFEEKQRTLELSNVMLHILDCWYNEELCKEESSGKERLLAILEDSNIRLNALAQKIRSGSATCSDEDPTQSTTGDEESRRLVGSKEIQQEKQTKEAITNDTVVDISSSRCSDTAKLSKKCHGKIDFVSFFLCWHSSLFFWHLFRH